MSEIKENLDTVTPEEDTPTAETVVEDEGKSKGSDKKKTKKLEAELAEAVKKLEAAEAELKEEKEKYLRMLAEYDNFRRRTAKEKEGIYTDATADAVRGLLPVVDTLERAVAGFGEGDADSPLGKGITMTLKSATDALAKLGVEAVETDTFNPDIHNAVMHVDDDSLPEGAIVEVYLKGYKKGDHVIRYAMVTVAN